MAKTKRRFTVFSLSFLDVMSCGFGAVVLIFLVINHRIETDSQDMDREQMAESRKLDYLITTGQKDLADLKDRVKDARRRVADATRALLAKTEDRDRRKAEIDELEARTIADEESIEALKTEVETRERDVRRLEAEQATLEGSRAREIKGDGDRQYLTGLFVGGKRVLIALDVSASMLDETIVQVIRRRNMTAERQRAAPKWQRAIRTVEWLTAQVPLDSAFQVLTYAEEARFLVADGGGVAARQADASMPTRWVAATEPNAIDSVLDALDTMLPRGGTNMHALADAINSMRPRPDNVFLITDGLPTRSTNAPRRGTVTGKQRLRLFEEAIERLASRTPVNTVLFPLEGDPLASWAYWQLARATGGTYMSPSKDWP